MDHFKKLYPGEHSFISNFETADFLGGGKKMSFWPILTHLNCCNQVQMYGRTPLTFSRELAHTIETPLKSSPIQKLGVSQQHGRVFQQKLRGASYKFRLDWSTPNWSELVERKIRSLKIREFAKFLKMTRRIQISTK